MTSTNEVQISPGNIACKTSAQEVGSWGNIPPPRYHETQKFLATIHPDRPHVLHAIDPAGTGGILSKTFGPTDFIEELTWLRARGEQGYNLYYSLNPPPRYYKNKKPTKAETTEVYFLHVDMDPEDNETPAVAKARYLQKLRASTVAPTVVVDSGNGIQALWRLGKPHGPEAEQVNRALELQFTGGTQAWNRDRIMRLPGTVNYPNANKIAKGRIPSLSSLVSQSEAVHALGSFQLIAKSSPTQLKKEPGFDRSDAAFKQMLKMLKAGNTDEQIEAWLMDPLNKVAGHYNEKLNPADEVAKDITRAKEKSAFEPDSEYSNEESIAKLPTDVGMAARFAQQQRGRVCHVPGVGYYVYDGTVWNENTQGRALNLAKETVLAMYSELPQEPDGSKRIEKQKLIEKYQRADRLAAMLHLAQPDLAVDASLLDGDPWLFNCENGTINLRTGRLQPHIPTDLITKLCPVAFDPIAASSLWQSVLKRSFNDDVDLIDYINKLFGMMLSADISVQEFWVFWGEGNNGKSLMLDTILSIMGGYACRAPDSLLTNNGRNEHPTELAGLQGRRLVVASETEDGASLKLQLVKRMTGDSTITARFMGKDYFEFPRRFKTILVTNNKPRISENGESAWRRIRLIPFQVVIPQSEIDPNLLQKLRSELAGILAWAVQGCLAWQQNGLQLPASVIEATNDYRKEEDGIGKFLDEFCVRGAEDFLAFQSNLYAVYSNWCKNGNTRPLPLKTFNERLDQPSRGLKIGRDSKTNTAIWIGIRLKIDGYGQHPTGLQKLRPVQ